MVAGQEAPEPLRLLPGPVDPAVDCLRADRSQAGLDPEPQPSGDLLRRPAFGQSVRDIGREPGIRLSVAVRWRRSMYAPSATCGR